MQERASSTMHPPIHPGLFILLSAAATLAAAALAGHSPADPSRARFYIGTYTNAEIKGVYTCVIDLDTGRLGPVQLAAETSNPSWVAVSPSGRFVYAANENAQGAVSAFRVEPDGLLTFLNKEDAGGDGTCFVSVDPSESCLLAANYGSGTISSFPILSGGALGAGTSLFQFTGSGPNRARQSESHAHSIYAQPGDRRIYACDLGADTVWSFAFDPARALFDSASRRAASAQPGSGPRHIAFRPDGRFVYVNGEMGLDVSVFARDRATGDLTLVQTVPTLEASSPNASKSSTAEIAVHPSGKWLYVSNRGDDTIAAYAIGIDGRLTWRGNASATVKTPRGFAIDPSGRWLLAAGQSDNRIAVLAIDPATGALSPTGQAVQVGKPVCIAFAGAQPD